MTQSVPFDDSMSEIIRNILFDNNSIEMTQSPAFDDSRAKTTLSALFNNSATNKTHSTFSMIMWLKQSKVLLR